MTNLDRQIALTDIDQMERCVAAGAPAVSRISDIASIASIMELRYRPAYSAGSAHLMTPAELDATISEIADRADNGVPNAKVSLAALIASRDARRTETEADRAWRLRQRIAWELVEEKKEIRRNSRLPGGADISWRS